MIIKTQTFTHFVNNLIGKEIKIENDVVGKIIGYDLETGELTVDVDSEKYSKLLYKKIAGSNVGISNKPLEIEQVNCDSKNDENVDYFVDCVAKTFGVPKKYLKNNESKTPSESEERFNRYVQNSRNLYLHIANKNEKI